MDNVNNQTMITILRGSHTNLLTTEQLKIAQARPEIESDLINDDLEQFYKFSLSQTKELRIREFRCLAFYKELTDSELKKLKPFQYEIDFQKQNWKTQTSLEALLPLLAQTDPGYQYLQCDCQRYTFSMSIELFHDVMSDKDFERLRSKIFPEFSISPSGSY